MSNATTAQQTTTKNIAEAKKALLEALELLERAEKVEGANWGHAGTTGALRQSAQDLTDGVINYVAACGV